MKKLIVSAVALSALFWVGCGDDDDDPPPVETTVTVTADTMTAPATPLVYNDDVWDDVTATSITLSTATALPVAPLRTPLGPNKALAAPSTVDVQAIKKGGRLYLRFQWTDSDLSMQRDNWLLYDVANFNFAPQIHLGEDQVVALFEGDSISGWDMWNWRVLTTGSQNKAEDGSMLDGATIWDAGANHVAYKNATPGDNSSPQRFPNIQWEFTGDLLYKSDTVTRSQALPLRYNWDLNQTVPGWYIDDEMNWAAITESRWDIEAVYNYAVGIGVPNLYTLVMARDLTAHEDDVDMSELTRIKTRVGILDNYYLDLGDGSSQRAFSEDFWLNLP